MKWETVVGLEIHVELRTKAKVFCGCSTEFGAEPNSQVCPVCLGMPGALPVLNERALGFAVMAGLAVNGTISPRMHWDRKNYFYPDIGKAYQISQAPYPVVQGGYVDIVWDGGEKRIRMNRIHLEEDTGKLTHEGAGSIIDGNRGGVGLLEAVTEPDIRSPEEARVFLQKLRSILAYTGISDVKMEEGSLRCDANVSVRPAGSTELRTRCEIKNLNSFRSVERAIRYEADRHIQVYESGGEIRQETRHWDEARGVTVAMRLKETMDDYRYFPEPDLPYVTMSPERIEQIRAQLPELPDARKARYIEQYGLTPYAADVMTLDRPVAEFFEQTVALYPQPETVANWVMGDLARIMNEKQLAPEQIPVTPDNLAAMLKLMDKGTISGKIAKTVLEEMCESGKDPATIVKEKGLEQMSDTGELEAVIDKVLAANEKVVGDYLGGKETAAGFLVGQVMKETRGRANPGMVNQLLRQKLDAMKG